VHISSDHLFSGAQSLVDELHPIAPVNVYAATKAEGESRVLDAHGGALIIRTNFYGWGPSYRRSFSDMVIDALRQGREVTLFTDVFFTPILIETMVEVVHDLVEMEVSGRFHVVGDERLSKYDFGRRIAEAFDFDQTLIKPGLIGDHDALVRRPYDMSLSNLKARELLGRTLGTVCEGIARLREQVRDGLASEMRHL